MSETKVRFWIGTTRALVRVTMRPGDVITTEGGGPDEEGCHWTWSVWTCHNDHIEHEYGSQGRDCDGPYSTYLRQVCPHGDLTAIPPEVNQATCKCLDERGAWLEVRPWVHSPECLRPALPKWVDEESWVNDVFARKAGY